ncbi:hypothetical protein B0T26DRAFT_789385 [Lasiosphaeria miniovina]|uniref:Uncharacterized protein n=1 Tax=Lasiosphaeria miniovina TaxID=1954250 RepID=A0AA39ZZC9_9PEZI|nr:uncharacterized protein B0T26DRAFT_789385 [Lasiosphaeria miniovina]KAK0706435.1 hypothetical protein B0T26DRAFT_789385 [Lasiosphaeria miniovina]
MHAISQPLMNRSAMPILPRKFDWDKEIEQTAAKDSFIICRPDEFPLSQVQAVAERVLHPEPSTFFSRKPVPRCSAAGNEILIDELKGLAGVFYVEEAAIVGCLHLFTWEVARWHLWKRIRPDLATANEDSFTSRISVYLQCIVVAQKADAVLVHDGEALAARQLLRILHHGKINEFPSVLELLATVTDTSCEELLPFDFLAEVLRRAKSQRWADAHSLVDGLQGLSRRADLPHDVRSWLPDLFSHHYAMWASWQPDVARIRAWKAGTTPAQRARLAPVLELEGPDTTPQQRSTLRHSSCGAFPDARSHGTHDNGRDILDGLLDLLDGAVRIGPNAVDLFIHLALATTATTATTTLTAASTHTHALTWHPLHQLSAAFSPPPPGVDDADSVPGTLLSFLRSLQHPPVSMHQRMAALTAVLPVLTSSTPLQALFGDAHDISVRAPRALSDAQRHFCCLLSQQQQRCGPGGAALPLGLAVRALGGAMLSSNWMLGRWKPAFVHMLGALPCEGEIRARFRATTTVTAEHRQAHLDYLAVTLGASEILAAAGGQVVMMTTPAVVVVVIEDEVWRAELDADRHALRKTLQGLRGVDWQLATRCLLAAAGDDDDDTFVRGVTGYIVGGSDQTCVNMARFLAPRVVGPGGDRLPARSGRRRKRECWVELCLWMMRRRPRGMLERLGADLSVESWNEWVGCLRVLFGDGHLGDKGALGFTAERMRQITIWKMSRRGVGRVHSASSRSTLSDY